MRFVTETRLKLLGELIQSIPKDEERSLALHLLSSIRSDIDDNYAEIESPISLGGIRRRPNGQKREFES